MVSQWLLEIRKERERRRRRRWFDRATIGEDNIKTILGHHFCSLMEEKKEGEGHSPSFLGWF